MIPLIAYVVKPLVCVVPAIANAILTVQLDTHVTVLSGLSYPFNEAVSHSMTMLITHLTLKLVMYLRH